MEKPVMRSVGRWRGCNVMHGKGVVFPRCCCLPVFAVYAAPAGGDGVCYTQGVEKNGVFRPGGAVAVEKAVADGG